MLNDLLHRRRASSAMLSFLLKTADLAARLHASFAHDQPQGGGSGSFLRKANLSTKGCSDISELLKKKNREIAQNVKNCSKNEKFRKICEKQLVESPSCWPGYRDQFRLSVHKRNFRPVSEIKKGH